MSAGAFTPKSLDQTRLVRRLEEPFAESSSTALAKKLAQVLPDICEIAANQMKLMPALHGEFTLHDETHLLRVTELMAKVMPEQVIINVLNPVEIALLILSAYFHDVGMVPDKAEAEHIRQNEEYQLARQNWLVEYTGFDEALRMVQNETMAGDDQIRLKRIVAEFEQAIFSRFIRDKHSELSGLFVKQALGEDERLRVGTGHLVDTLALLCVSHNLPPESITDSQGFHFDKAVGTYSVNLAYLATVLRLADILDFDRERTPDQLYRSISFTNSVSIQEWEKHRQVEGWKIDRDAVRFECACERPEYEQAIRHFLRFIDGELAAAHDLIRRFPSGFAKYAIDLPTRTDSSRVRARDGSYLYAGDLEITLNRDEIVHLLMTDKLYGHPSLAIRELLQNAWDALRHRKAIMMRDDGVEWTGGFVKFEHGVNEHGCEFICCIDNGVGMDQRIIKDYLVRVGRSYYRSPAFERERLTFAHANADFDPCARFGIGFMSLFMLGDQITIHTRRYSGSSGGLGEPLIVEINGLGSLIVLRRGAENQPAGTSIQLIGRRKPDRFATWKDNVQLVDTLYSYALAGEFPVSAKCSIPEIEDAIDIPAKMAEPWHPFTEYGVKNGMLFEQDFSEVDARLRGKIKCGVPLSDDGGLVVENTEAGWRQGEKPQGAEFFVALADRQQHWNRDGRTCLDGILVAGPHGRGHRDFLIVGTQYPNPVGFGQDLFVLDVRGTLKPELSPSRGPAESHGIFDDRGPGWRRLQRLAASAHGRLWMKVINKFCTEKDAETLWQLMALHHVSFEALPHGFMWARLLVPSIGSDGALSFRTFSQLVSIPFDFNSQKPFATEESGLRVGVTDGMDKWRDRNDFRLLSPALRKVVINMATLNLAGDRPTLEFIPPAQPDEIGFSHVVIDRFSRYTSIPFAQGLEGVLAAVTSERLLNKRHPVASYLFTQQGNTADDPEYLFLHCLAGSVLENGALEALSSGEFSTQKFNWHFSSLGFYFRSVDIASLKPECRPPYRCWLPVKGYFDITENILEKLSDIQTIDWHRRREPRFI
jgi:hypothetical protein